MTQPRSSTKSSTRTRSCPRRSLRATWETKESKSDQIATWRFRHPRMRKKIRSMPTVLNLPSLADRKIKVFHRAHLLATKMESWTLRRKISKLAGLNNLRHHRSSASETKILKRSTRCDKLSSEYGTTLVYLRQPYTMQKACHCQKARMLTKKSHWSRHNSPKLKKKKRRRGRN